MGFSIVNCTEKNSQKTFWGVMDEKGVYPLKDNYESHKELMAAYFSDAKTISDNLMGECIQLDDVTFNSPVSRDVQLYCQGLNYADHRDESGMSTTDDEDNLVFMKAPSSICGPNDTIVRPAGCELLDYEVELALILKEDIKQPTSISEANLKDYVGALVLCNDVSARDDMFGAPMLQWFKGKSHRTFCPMGPVLYLMDEADFENLYALKLELKWNGKVMQSATTDQLIHRPAETLTEISSYADISMGDCLLTGTPGGVLAGSNLKVGLAIITNMKNDKKRRKKFTQAQLAQTRFLEPGDTLDLSIQSLNGKIDLGTQHNVIADS